MVYASQVIQASAQRARELVGDLLTYSCTVREEQKLQEIGLREEIELVLSDLSQLIAETKAEVNIEIPDVKIRADKSQFARLMHNILSNAIKYRKPDQPPKISIVAEPATDSTFRLAIADNGIGFDEEFAHMIFEPFVRLQRGARYPGTGIGLAICKSVADRHGWDISVKSRPGQGTTFFLEIPRLNA
jgi:signal transduction histidine kinase